MFSHLARTSAHSQDTFYRTPSYTGVYGARPHTRPPQNRSHANDIPPDQLQHHQTRLHTPAYTSMMHAGLKDERQKKGSGGGWLAWSIEQPAGPMSPGVRADTGQWRTVPGQPQQVQPRDGHASGAHSCSPSSLLGSNSLTSLVWALHWTASACEKGNHKKHAGQTSVLQNLDSRRVLVWDPRHLIR